jgi:hypothetical protein
MSKSEHPITLLKAAASNSVPSKGTLPTGRDLSTNKTKLSGKSRRKQTRPRRMDAQLQNIIASQFGKF